MFNCHVCDKRLFEEDIFMEQGERMFCSEECWNVIANPLYECLIFEEPVTIHDEFHEILEMAYAPTPYLILCDEEGCENEATVSWSMRDEEGDYYYTERCEDHPKTDSEYTVADL